MQTLEIEWRHLDVQGSTCERCADTGSEARDAVAELAKECAPQGWNITFRETLLTEKEIADSNLVLFNGVPIEQVLRNATASESHCASCCDLTGKADTACRTVEHGGRSFETIPADLIRQAACAVAKCC